MQLARGSSQIRGGALDSGLAGTGLELDSQEAAGERDLSYRQTTAVKILTKAVNHLH